MNRLATSVRAAVALLGLSAATLIQDTRRAEACRMPLRRSVPVVTSTPEGSDTPKTLVLVDKQTVMSEAALAELERLSNEGAGGALLTLLDPFAEVRQLLHDLAPELKRSPFADRGSCPRAPRWLRKIKRQAHRSSRNQTRPRSHVVRSLRVSRQSR